MMSAKGVTEFGRRLRAARAYGQADGSAIDRETLAAALDTSIDPIRAWETGSREPSRPMRRGVIATIHDLTGLPSEFFEVDFSELRAAMEATPALHLDWSPEQEMGEGGSSL